MSFTVDLDDLGHSVSVEMLQQQHMIELDASMGRTGPQGERGPMGPSAGETFTTARSLKAWWPLQRALDAGTGVVAWMGDSKSEGTGVQREDQRALARFRVMLRDRWVLPADTGVGYVPAHYYNFYPLDPQPTITGDHTPVGYEGGVGNRSVHLQPGAVVTWPAMTYSAAVGVPVHWTRMEANGSLEVLIDDTVAATIDTQGSPRASMRTVVPITDGEHVVAVRASGTLAARIEGIVNESAPTGAKVHDAARSGGTLHQFTQGTVSPEQVKRHWEAMTLLQPDLIVAAFGANDMSSYTPQQWAANLKRTVELRDQYLPDTGLLLLHGAQRVEDTPGRLRQYEETALETLANVPLVSILWESALWQPRPGHTYRGDIDDPDDWLSDSVHLTPASSEAIAEYLLGSLAQGMPAAKGDTGDLTSRWLTGTGSPEGVHAAPVGTVYTDEDATSGAVEWTKFAGTDTTGWRVTKGDTGWRDVSASLAAGWATSSLLGRALMRRTADGGVEFDGRLVPTGATVGANRSIASLVYVVPPYFRPRNDHLMVGNWLVYPEGPQGLARVSSTRLQTQVVAGTPGVWGGSDLVVIGGKWSMDNSHWPTTLPGTPA